jgi:hypothetical protein
LRIALVVPAQGDGLEDDDQQRQPHGELREKIVEGHREGEVNSVQQEHIHDGSKITRAMQAACDMGHIGAKSKELQLERNACDAGHSDINRLPLCSCH